MKSKLMNKFSIIVVMLSLFITTPFYVASASNEYSGKQSIKSMFPNNATAVAVADAYHLSLGRPKDRVITVDEELSMEELGRITELSYDKFRPIPVFDKDIEKLKGLKKLTIFTIHFKDLSGIEVLGDRLEYLSLNSTSITSIDPLASLYTLTSLNIIGTGQITNDAIINNPEFTKPLENLNLKDLYFLYAALDDRHTDSISKITSLKSLIIKQGKVSDFEPFSNLTNLTHLDLSNNSLVNLKGFNKLVNLKSFTANTDGDNSRKNNRFYDYGDVLYPKTSIGTSFDIFDVSNVTSYLPLTLEYIKDDLGEYQPVYYFDLNKIIPPQPSNGIPFEYQVKPGSKVDRVDYEENRVYLNREIVERNIYERGTNILQEFDFDFGTFKFIQPSGLSLSSGDMYLAVDSLEIKGDLPPSKTVNVEFVYNNGTPNTKLELELNEVLAKPDTPVHGENVFAGWYVDSEFHTKWNFEDQVTEDMTLYAKWDYPVSTKYYEFKFDTVGGNLIKSLKLEENEKAVRPVDPVKEGYVFTGWYTDSEYKELYDFDTLINDDMTIYAQWEKVIVYYDVIFETMGGSDIEDQRVEENTAALVPSTPTRKGFTFEGWYIDLDDESAFDFSTKITEDVTIYAKWKAIPVFYNVKFDTLGGSKIETQKVREFTSALRPQTPTKEGHIFKGWFVSLDYLDLHDFSKLITDHITIYAKWEPVQVFHTVTFDTLGGNDILEQKVLDNTSVEMPEAPSKLGFIFKGWTSDLDEAADFDFKTLITNDITLYAKWELMIPAEELAFNVSFDSKGGSEVKDQTVLENNVAVKPVDPTKEGYIFLGWFKDLNDETNFDFESIITSNMVLFAKWEKMLGSFTVDFDPMGGSAVPSQKVVENSFATEPVAPKKMGYQFKGWYADKEFTTKYDFNLEINYDTVVYAKWVKDKEVLPSTGISMQSNYLIAGLLVISGFAVIKFNSKYQQED